MMRGAHFEILHVDLSRRYLWVEQAPEEVYRLLVGGRALIAYLLLRDTAAGLDPLGPGSPLIFAPGIMQGTNLPGSGRHAVGGKSPLTGALGSSEVGGWWGNEFKRTGFDALVVEGQARSPVYLWIEDGHVEIRCAEHLWGLETAPTQAAIREELGDDRIRVAQIGPAGENQVLYANVIHDVNRAAGRNGLGALMGSKKLKAVAVRGTRRVHTADPAELKELARWLGDNYRDLMAGLTRGLGRGTQDSLMNWAELGGLPTKNFSRATFDQPERLSGERNYEMFLEGRDTCHACPVHCKQVFRNEDDDPYRRLDPVYGGAEYEAMAAFGPCCLVTDNLAVLKANELCNTNGLDTISTAMSIAFVMECFEKGVLTDADTGGLHYAWGNGDLVVRSVEMIAHRQGFGDVMANGVARMSEAFGPATEAFNLTIKGQELPMHEPRLKQAMGVGYAVAPVGADHMMNMHDSHYVTEGRALRRVNAALDEPVGPLPPDDLGEDKMQIFYREVNWKHFADCALICCFYCYDYEKMARALSAVTGQIYEIGDVLDVGARAQTLGRLFNYREGFTAEDDRLPERVTEAFDEGPLDGVEITQESFDWAKRRFYELMGWDPTSGAPTKACLHRLKLDGVLE